MDCLSVLTHDLIFIPSPQDYENWAEVKEYLQRKYPNLRNQQSINAR